MSGSRIRTNWLEVSAYAHVSIDGGSMENQRDDGNISISGESFDVADTQIKTSSLDVVAISDGALHVKLTGKTREASARVVAQEGSLDVTGTEFKNVAPENLVLSGNPVIGP